MIHIKRRTLFTNQARFGVNAEALSGTEILTVDDYIVQWLDPDGTSRNVDLPAEESSANLMFMILNTGTTAAKTLTIRNDASATIATLFPGMSGIFSCDGTNWKWENKTGLYYDGVDDRAYIGAIAPLYGYAAVDNYWFANGNMVLERNDDNTPQFKIKSAGTNTNITGIVAFKDLNDGQQHVLETTSSDHPTEARQFQIAEQHQGGTWYTPFKIKPLATDDTLVIDISGISITKSDNAQIQLISNGTTNTGTLIFRDTGDNQKWLFSVRSSDHASEARQFKITEYNQGSTWYDPFTIKPTTPNNALVLDPTKVNVGLPLVRSQTPQTLTGAGAVDVTSSTTLLITDDANALTFADGSEGQEKFIVMKTDGGVGTLTPTNLKNGSTLTFDDVGDSAHLVFIDGAWVFMGGTATLGA